MIAAQNATIEGSRLSEGSAVFTGERLAAGDGGEVLVQCGGIRLALKENSAMRTFQAGTKTIVELEHGTILYATLGNSEDLSIYSLDIRIVPVTSRPAAGQVSSPSRCQISVYPTKSSATVTSGKETKVIEESKSYAVTALEGIDYRDDWKPVLSDYPEFPRDAAYHRSHGHAACAPAFANNTGRPPVQAVGQGHFREIAIGIIGGVSIIPIKKALESPDRP
ncbi:MAG: hypothetical protein JSS69_14430 [Acidobacteria bacterium]|nr:hypothetical protein [Acidobacteriota bacterium]MBS1867108.1 hypothetical protein [Acidobacteriota bacterium]